MLVCPVCHTEYDDLERRRCATDSTPLEEKKAPATPPPSPDAKILAGKYRVLRQLGAGGMAIVYLVDRIKIGDYAAVKVMNRTVAGDPESLARFEMEARLAASASHPNVVQIYDFGVTDENLPFLVMEYLEGPTLSEELERYGTLSLERAIEVFQPVCAAVNAAHASGLIHRDLKPSNVLLQQLKGGGECVKVVDFGIAKTVQPEANAELTNKGAVVGTLGYMSLEQVRGEELDHRSDVYSLGVIFYELLTGQLPFGGNSPAQILVAMAKEQPRSLKSIRPDVPTRIELAVFKALSKNRNDRQASAAEFAQELIDATVRAKPIFVPKQADDTSLPTPVTMITGETAAATKWRGVAGTLNLDICLGRERELEILKESFAQNAQGQGQPISILADSGAGRSQLLLEFQRWVERAGGVVLPGRFYDYGGSQLAPYQVFLDMLRACLLGQKLPPITQKLSAVTLKQQQESTDTSQLAEMIQFRTGVTIPGEAFSAEALSGAGGTNDKWRVFESLTEIFKRIAKSSPVVFLLDDLHFADSLSLELLAYIIRNTAGARIQVVMTALTEAAQTAGKPLRTWFVKQLGHGNYREISLAGLPRSEGELLLKAIFGEIEIREEALDYIWNETQGFPLYLIELLEHLMMTGKIERVGEEWRATWFGQLEVPPSVNNLVNAKLRRFGSEALEVFKHAAVIGDEFQFEALAEVMDIDEDALDEVLREGVTGWIFKEQKSAAGDIYRFQHAMLRRALYNSMAKANRRRVHVSVAEALEGLHGAKKERVVGQIAYHFYWGGEWNRAFEPAVKAGEVARKREAFNEAVTYFHFGKEALEQLKSEGVTSNTQLAGKMYTGLAETLILVSRFDEAEIEIAHIFELAGQQQDARIRAWGEFLASRLNHSRGNMKRAVELARMGLESLESLPDPNVDPELHRRLLQQLGFTLWMTGQLDTACESLEKAVALTEASADNRPGGWALSYLGLIHCFRGNGTLGLELGEKGLRLLRASGDRVSELLAWERVGIICSMLGDQDRAIYFFDNGLELAKTIGHKLQQTRMLVNLGEAHRLKNNLAEAEQYYRRALQMAEQLEQPDVEALCMQNLGLVAIAREQFAEAVELLEKSLPLFRAQHREISEAEVLWALGRAREGTGDAVTALECYEQAAIICRKLSYLDFEWRALLGQGNLYFATARNIDAKRVLDEAVAVIEKLREQLPEGSNLKSFQEEKQPVFDLLTKLSEAS